MRDDLQRSLPSLQSTAGLFAAANPCCAGRLHLPADVGEDLRERDLPAQKSSQDGRRSMTAYEAFLTYCIMGEVMWIIAQERFFADQRTQR